MRTTDERMAAVTKRAAELKKQERCRKSKLVSITSIVACLVLVVGAGLAMPGVIAGLSDSSTNYTGLAASLFAGGDGLGYILCGILAFALGVCVTILCYRLHQRGKEDEDD